MLIFGWLLIFKDCYILITLKIPLKDIKMGCMNSKSEESSIKIIYCPNNHAMKYKHLSNPKNTCSSCHANMK